MRAFRASGVLSLAMVAALAVVVALPQARADGFASPQARGMVRPAPGVVRWEHGVRVVRPRSGSISGGPVSISTMTIETIRHEPTQVIIGDANGYNNGYGYGLSGYGYGFSGYGHGDQRFGHGTGSSSHPHVRMMGHRIGLHR